jgi:hypothetical protein
VLQFGDTKARCHLGRHLPCSRGSIRHAGREMGGWDTHVSPAFFDRAIEAAPLRRVETQFWWVGLVIKIFASMRNLGPFNGRRALCIWRTPAGN